MGIFLSGADLSWCYYQVGGLGGMEIWVWEINALLGPSVVAIYCIGWIRHVGF